MSTDRIIKVSADIGILHQSDEQAVYRLFSEYRHVPVGINMLANRQHIRNYGASEISSTKRYHVHKKATAIIAP